MNPKRETSMDDWTVDQEWCSSPHNLFGQNRMHDFCYHFDYTTFMAVCEGIFCPIPVIEVRPILLDHHPQVWVEAEEIQIELQALLVWRVEATSGYTGLAQLQIDCECDRYGYPGAYCQTGVAGLGDTHEIPSWKTTDGVELKCRIY